MHAYLPYLLTSFVYLCVDVLACWAMNLSYGLTGVYNIGLIVFQAAGAYAAAVVTIGPSSAYGGFQHYIGGYHLPFPLPIIIGGLAGGVLSLAVGAVALRRLRTDYQAMVLLTFAVLASLLVTDVGSLFNGAAGMALIPQPLHSLMHLSSLGYNTVFAGISAAVCVVVYFFLHRITSSPLGRALRMVRENEAAASSLGKSPFSLRLFSFVVAGTIAGLSGALIVEYLTVWAPSGWTYPETLVLLTAVIVGGVGNDGGVILGSLLIPVALVQGSTSMPQFGPPQLVPALSWIAISVVGLGFIYFRPKGLIPERKRKFSNAMKSRRVAERTFYGNTKREEGVAE